MSRQGQVDIKVPENTVDRVEAIDIDPKEERVLVRPYTSNFSLDMGLILIQGMAFGFVLLDYRVPGLCIQVSRSDQYRE